MIAYGVKINSDIALPYDIEYRSDASYEIGLWALGASHRFDSLTVSITMPVTHGRDVVACSDRKSDRIEKGQPICYEIRDVAAFYWVAGETDIYYEILGNGNAKLLGFWFLHLLLPYYLTIEGIYTFFHAGAVEIGGRPVLFSAPSMGGKSTMTDYFIQRGHALVSDDKIATYLEEGRLTTVGSHPYHRPYRRYEDLGRKAENFQSESRPVHIIFLLEKSGEDAEIAIEEIRGARKFAEILPSCLFAFSYLVSKRFDFIAGALDDVRMYRVLVPWDKARLDEVYKTICDLGRGEQ
jgi:hypothetical protein